MEPNPGDKRLEDVSASDPDGIDRSLPPPPPPGSPPTPQLPSIPESLQRPRNRVFIPAAVLVVFLPIAVWHLMGYQTVEEYLPYQYHSLKAPNWLNDLPHPLGTIAAFTVLASLGWLVVEYWLRGWRNWWFVVLGALCLMGAYTASGGRYGTAGIGRVSPDETDWPNILGWIFLLGAPAVYGALFLVAGIALLKIDPARLDAIRLPKSLKSRPLLVSLSFVPGWLVISVVVVWKATTAPSLDVLSEGIPELVAFIIIYALVLSPFMLFFIACAAACLFAIWLALFPSADLVLRRKRYW